MTKSKPNHELWKLFVYVIEGLSDRTFVMPVVEKGTMALSHTGVDPEDMEIAISEHAYLPMTRIRVDFNLPVELDEYLKSDDPTMPAGAKELKKWFDERGPVEYLIYNVMVKTILDQLTEIRKGMSEATTYEDQSKLKELIKFLANLSMEDVAEDISKHRNKHYPMVVNRVPNAVVPEPSDEWIDKHFGDMTAGDVQHVETVVNRNAKRIADSLGKIGDLVNDWSGKTEQVKDNDLWFSLNIEDHKITLGLDFQPYRSESDFVIERTPVDLAVWGEDNADREILFKIQEHIDHMNIIIGNLLNFNTGYEVLNKEIEQLYFRAIHHPIAKHTVRVWGFDDVCEAGRAKIDEEISWILETINDISTNMSREVKLDISNMYLHTTQDGEAFILPHEEQLIAKRCQTYSGTFYDALHQHLFDVETELFAPYTNVKPADLDTTNVITEQDLLNSPTIH